MLHEHCVAQVPLAVPPHYWKHRPDEKVGSIGVVLLDGGGNPVSGRKDNRPEIGGGTIKFEGDIIKLHALLLDANYAAAHFGFVPGVVEKEGLAHVQVGAHFEEAAMSVDHLGFGRFLELFAVLIFSQDDYSDAQDHALTPPAVWCFGHAQIRLFASILRRKQWLQTGL